MTSQRSVRIKVSILSAFVLSLAALTVLLAFAAPAQQAETGKSAKSSIVSAPTQASIPAMAMLPVPQRAPDSPISFLPAASYDSGGIFASSVAVTDVNGDGKPDLLVANQAEGVLNHGSVGVLLGNGDGTFQAVLTYDSGDDNTTAVAVADVNGDGKPDLLVSNLGTTAGSTVGVLLGNGDGTFQAAVTYASGGNYAFSVAVADVNGDGKPDLVVANCSPGCFTAGVVSVLLGNGDGTFQSALSFDSGGSGAVSVAIADVNGDAKPDLIVANSNGTVGVLLGNGDGTFLPAVIYGSGGSGAIQSGSVVVADINGDGKPDLLVANAISSVVGVLLGNGDGTFQPAVSYGSGGISADSVAVADVTGDGKPDLLVTNQCASDCSGTADGTVAVLLGNGDGTFQAAITFGSGGAFADSVAVSDVNADGKLDLLVANLCLTQSGGQCFGNGTLGVLLNNTGTQSATATTLTSSQNPSTDGQPITWTAAVTTSGPIAPTGTVNFKRGPDGMGTGTLNASGVATFATSILKPGPYKITAVYKGDASNLTSTSAVLHQGVKR